TEVSFCVKRFGSQKNVNNQYFSCSCYYTNFSEIICRHIFKVAAQLNLDEISQYLFLIRWRKDLNDNILVKKYKSFYNETNPQNENINDTMENEDYEYLLNRTWYKVQQIVKAKPEVAKNFYLLLDKSVKEEISHTSGKRSQIQNNEKIKNPTIVKPKGKCSLKYLFI